MHGILPIPMIKSVMEEALQADIVKKTKYGILAALYEN